MNINKTEKIIVIIIAGLISGLLIGFSMGITFPNEENSIKSEIEIEPIDYSNRFDRLEAGIRNSTLDICFQWGGQWITDQNNLAEQDFDIPLSDGGLLKGKAILCVKQA